MTVRKNKNRGFMQLRLWQDAVDLYVLANTILKSVHFEHNKSKSNTLDSAHSIIRNIAGGYCRSRANASKFKRKERQVIRKGRKTQHISNLQIGELSVFSLRT